MVGCPACERMTGPNPPREQTRPIIHENVPVITQYASPGLIEAIAYAGHDPGDDPAWATTGATSRAEYAAWCRHICGMACLQMVLAHRDGQAPALLELLRAGPTRVRDLLRRTRDHPRQGLTAQRREPDVDHP